MIRRASIIANLAQLRVKLSLLEKTKLEFVSPIREKSNGSV